MKIIKNSLSVKQNNDTKVQVSRNDDGMGHGDYGPRCFSIQRSWEQVDRGLGEVVSS